MSIIKLNNRGVKDATAFGSITGLGNLILIKTQTASDAASIEFKHGTSDVVIDSTYKEYIFFMNNMHPATDGQNLMFNLSSDTGSNYNVTKTTAFFRAAHNEDGSSGTINYRTGEDLAQSTGEQRLNMGTNGSDADSGSSGYLHLFDPSSTTFVKHFIARNSDAFDEPGAVDSYVAGYANTTSAVDGIRFKFGSGNIGSGTISLYGVS